jgi:hypothetical protein
VHFLATDDNAKAADPGAPARDTRKATSTRRSMRPAPWNSRASLRARICPSSASRWTTAKSRWQKSYLEYYISMALGALIYAFRSHLCTVLRPPCASDSLRCLLSTAAIAAAAASRPNILFIFSDDHGTQAISAYGEKRHLIHTPNIDRIAREGIRFDRCLVTNSLCGPSRATVLTGKYSHLNGFYNNTNSRFDGSQTTFPKLLRAAGYQTALVRKVAPRFRPHRL